MNEFIEKLIERLEKLPHAEDDWWVWVDDVKETIYQLAEEYKGGWIPVEQRLPKDCGDVICTAKVKDKANKDILFLWYNTETKYWCYLDDEQIKGIDVIAWMPMPEPFQKGE